MGRQQIDELEAEVQLQRDFISNAEKKSDTATTLGIVGILVGIAGALAGIFLVPEVTNNSFFLNVYTYR